MQILFERREELVPGIWQYWFKPERPVDFEPGQYVDLQLPNVPDDPRGATRTFSLTSLPADPSISFVVKHFELQSPYKHRLQSLLATEEASIGDAMGDMILPKLPSVPLVYVAGGIGISSYASMLAQLLASKEERPVFLFYALRAAREQIFRELTNAYPLQLKQLVIAPNRLGASEIIDLVPPDSQIYLSGSQKFVDGLRAEFAEHGMPHEQIVFDYYDGYTEL